MDDRRRTELELIALEIRKDVVRMVGVARSCGLSSALTAVDLLVYLYWEQMKISPGERARPDRDRLVLSKGSAAPSLYACLARLGFFRREELWSYRRLGAMLQGYPDIRTPGVDAPGGAHGGGVGIASGLCLALRLDEVVGARVFCVMDEGEAQAGVVWESLRAAAACGLDNLVLLVDANARMSDADGLREKFRAFGWYAADADGHDFHSLEGAFAGLPSEDGKPKAILVRTCAGSGVSFLEQGMLADSCPLSNEEMDMALSQLEASGAGRQKGAGAAG